MKHAGILLCLCHDGLNRREAGSTRRIRHMECVGAVRHIRRSGEVQRSQSSQLDQLYSIIGAYLLCYFILKILFDIL